LIATSELTLRVATIINQETPQPKPGRTALAKAVFDEAALFRKY
jgi:hypothetical protein